MADNERDDGDDFCEATGMSVIEETDCVTEKESKTTPKNDKEKKPSFVKTIRESIKRGVMSPLSSKNKVQNATTDNDNTLDTPVQPPALPLHNGQEEATTKVAETQMPYIFPEIPEEPLSVMQIDRLIKDEILDEAYVNLLSLQQEYYQEVKGLGNEIQPVPLANKEKDLILLYKTLRDKLTEIVRHSCTLPSNSIEHLKHVSCIIQEQEKQNEDIGGLGKLRVSWKSAVKNGANDTIKKVNLDSQEQNPAWLAVHLGQVGKVIVEDLRKVKEDLMSAYPPSFNVFDTYVSAFHDVVSEHIRQLFPKVIELKDYYALLDFIIKQFGSEKIMGHISLKPEVREEHKMLNLDKDFLEQIKNLYCKRLQSDVKLSLKKLTELEHDEMWKDQKNPLIDDELYDSHLHMDIWTNIKGQIQASSWLDVNMEQRAMLCCIEELKEFPKQFESAFVQWSDTIQDPSLWVDYHITYINSFTCLKEHMEDYRTKCPDQMQQLDLELDEIVKRLCHSLLEHYKMNTKPFLGKMMTKNWLSSDEDFHQLQQRIKSLSEKSKHMILQHLKTFVNDIHYYVVKEYISQMMKNKMSCKNRKNEKAANKIEVQWGQLSELFQEMNSSQDWLYPVGNHLSKIIKETKKSEIPNHLQPLVNDYPDFSTRHLSGVLYFCGVFQNRDKQIILQQLSKIKQQSAIARSTQNVLFSEIETSEITGCLSNMPFSCFSLHTSNS